MSDARIEIPASLEGERVDRAVAMLLDVSRSVATRLIADGSVMVGGEPVTAKSATVAEGDVLVVAGVPEPRAGLEPDASVTFAVAYEDEHVLVVDKPAGLVVHPGAGTGSTTLAHGLVAKYPELRTVGDPERPGIVHRLDQGTTGLLMVAREVKALDSLQAQLRDRTLRRRYRCLVHGHPESPTGTIDAPIGRSPRDPTRRAVRNDGKPARTHYEVIDQFESPEAVAELWCDLETGRTHQIRVHLSAIELPLVGDTRYGAPSKTLASRPMLHAAQIAFDHPETGERIEVASPLPADYVALRERLA